MPKVAPTDPAMVSREYAVRRFLRGYVRDTLRAAVGLTLLGRGIQAGFGGRFAWDGLGWTLVVGAANIALLIWAARKLLYVQAGFESPGYGAAFASSVLFVKPVAMLAVYGTLLLSYGAISVATGLVLSIVLLCLHAWLYSTYTSGSEYEPAPNDRFSVTLEP